MLVLTAVGKDTFRRLPGVMHNPLVRELRRELAIQSSEMMSRVAETIRGSQSEWEEELDLVAITGKVHSNKRVLISIGHTQACTNLASLQPENVRLFVTLECTRIVSKPEDILEYFQTDTMHYLVGIASCEEDIPTLEDAIVRYLQDGTSNVTEWVTANTAQHERQKAISGLIFELCKALHEDMTHHVEMVTMPGAAQIVVIGSGAVIQRRQVMLSLGPAEKEVIATVSMLSNNLIATSPELNAYNKTLTVDTDSEWWMQGRMFDALSGFLSGRIPAHELARHLR